MGLSYGASSEPKVAPPKKEQKPEARLEMYEQIDAIRKTCKESTKDHTEKLRLLNEHIAVDKRLDQIKHKLELLTTV